VNNGVLYMVATPIGNLSDMGARAVEVLRSVQLIACEDTRKSRILLQRWNIPTKVTSLHRFSESKKAQTILDCLDRGDAVAIISDAGTPAISDPGHRIVRLAMEAGFRVVPIPGPSSIITALCASGMDCSTFLYAGFLPRKDTERRAVFEEIAAEERTSVFFESPKRLLQSLKIASELLGSRRMVLMRELTKLHEEILPGTAASLFDTLSQREALLGEIVLVVEGRQPTGHDMDVGTAVQALMQEGFAGKRLAEEALKRFSIKKRDAYQTYLELKETPKQDPPDTPRSHDD
jgi:16S rRNA (cytidine1402-2'-O)-methyltransferase